MLNSLLIFKYEADMDDSGFILFRVHRDTSIQHINENEHCQQI